MFSKFRDKIQQTRQPIATPQAPSAPQTTNRGDRKGKILAAVAEETIEVLPALLEKLPNLDATHSVKYDLVDLAPLKTAMCPGARINCEDENQPQKSSGTRITVVNADSFDTAIGISTHADATDTNPSLTAVNHRVAVLNLASDKNPGGGWLHGAAAQEEALCFRSSLTLSLHPRYYPWTAKMGLYTRDVLIIRSAMDAGHALLYPDFAPADLPVVSVISVAGLRSPPLTADRQYFADIADRELTKDKMRLCLRIAGTEKHRHLVLGAIGCGAFANPPYDVAMCWLEVLREEEFAGGWWETICFAVYDSRNEGNFAVFRDILDNKIV